MKKNLTSVQKRILVICAATYCAAYLCRLNLAAALNAIMNDLNLSMAQGGTLASVFAVVYAVGQLVNGTIIHKVNPIKHLLTGLLGSAVSNITLSLTSSYAGAMICVFCNAAFQSMMWTPIMTIVADAFDAGSRQMSLANKTISYIMILGHFVSWAISGYMAEQFKWQYSFLIPGCIAVFVFAICSLLARKAVIKTVHEKDEKQSQTKSTVWGILLASGFLFTLLASLILGCVRDTVQTWTPTILNSLSESTFISPAGISLILPLINIGGVTIGYAMRDRGWNPHWVGAIMMTTAFVTSIPLFMSRSIVVIAISLSLIGASMYGCNTMLTSLIPISYHFLNSTGLTAGLIDCTIYFGSALSGVVSGAIMDHFGLKAIFIVLALASLLGVVSMYIAGKMFLRCILSMPKRREQSFNN